MARDLNEIVQMQLGSLLIQVAGLTSQIEHLQEQLQAVIPTKPETKLEK